MHDDRDTGHRAALSKDTPGLVEAEVRIPTPDGDADCYWVHPESGRHAAVFTWPDVVGVRPAFRGMARRLAASGYAVLLVNPYYRTASGQVVPDGKTIRDPGVRELVTPHRDRLSPQTCISDGRAIVEWLDRQPAVDTSRGIGVTGYCMSGSWALRIAAALPDRIRAAGSFHGGGLVTEADDSPHRLVDRIAAGVLIAIADNDDQKQPEAKDVLREAFDRAGGDAEIEVYTGAQHGWCPPDSAAYDEDAAERAWARLLALLERRLA